MIKLLPLIFESEVNQEEDLGNPHVLSERGYNFLKNKIDELNKKAVKWGVPTMTLKIVKEEFVKKQIPVNFATGQQTTWDDISHKTKEVVVKQYEVIIEGEPPRVEGYEFIAKIEHTPEGNILNYAPQASSKSIPVEYRTARQSCDVCKTNRDRNNTFILKLEKEDLQRFPYKKSGDYVMVGSGCLKRFLPNISVSALIGYAEMIEQLRSSISGASEMEDDFGFSGGGGTGNWMESVHLGTWLSAVYLHTGKYISKKKAAELETSSTLERAFFAMNPGVGVEHGRDVESEVHRRMRTEEEFRSKAEALNKEFLEWAKTKDFDTLIQQKPEFADFFHNLKVIAKQDVFKSQNCGFFAALFQLFLRDRSEMEKIAARKKATADFTYFGEVGQKTRVKVKVNKIKEYESQFGQGLIVTMEGEQIATDASGQSAVKKGNLIYFTNNFELEEGEEAEIEATVKAHQNNKYTQIPETQITRAKIVNFITHPEKNTGKVKVKDLSGTVEVKRIYERKNWKTQQKEYFMDFRYDLNTHPDMRMTNSPDWGIGFTYQIPDEATYQSMKQYEGKLINAKWSLERAMNMDKFKLNYAHPVNKFKAIQVLGDVSQTNKY